MNRLKKYRGLIKKTWFATTGITLLVLLFGVPSFPRFQKTGDNFYKVSINGTEIGNSSDPEEPGDALDYSGSCYSSKDRDLTVIYWTNSAPVLVQDGEYTELTLEGDNEIGPFCSMPSLNLSGDELLTVGELESNGDDYFAAFDLDGNELARSSQPVGSFNAVMMKRPNGYLLDTGYMWELYAPDGTFLEKSLPVGERETLCQLCGDFCTFDVFLPLEENAFLAVGHHGKATEPDEPVVFRITTDF